MITVFHIISFISAVVGLMLGILLGARVNGWSGSAMGAVVGAFFGLLIGRLPGIFSQRALVRSIRRKTTTELQEILQGKEYYIFHLAIAELAVRGEDIQKQRKHVLNLLTSEPHAARVCGWRTLRYFYPEAATQIEAYRPNDPVDVCRTKIQTLLLDKHA